jgi:hypothetical protein
VNDRDKRDVTVHLNRYQKTAHIENGIRVCLRFDGAPTVGLLMSLLRDAVPEGTAVENVQLGNVTASWTDTANETELAQHAAWRAKSEAREAQRVDELARALEAYHGEHPNASYEELTRVYLAQLRRPRTHES